MLLLEENFHPRGIFHPCTDQRRMDDREWQRS